VLSAFGFSEYEINLSTRPDKFVGDDAIWSTAEAALKEALDAKGWTYSVDEGGEFRKWGGGLGGKRSAGSSSSSRCAVTYIVEQ
jgi:hypothetical protein